MVHAASFSTLVEMLEVSCARYADARLFGTRNVDGWQWVTYRRFAELVAHCRSGLTELGVRPGDRVAVISNNRIEWAIAAHATYSLGAIYVPMYENQSESEWEYILRDSGASVCFVATAAILARVSPLRADCPSLLHLVSFDAVQDHRPRFDALIAGGPQRPVTAWPVAREDVATFIYTSGTTGEPKGVKLTHGNLATNVSAILAVSQLGADEVSIGFLPWAHVYGGCLELHTAIASGSAVAICGDPLRLTDFMLEVRPTLLFAVPRIWNRIYDGITSQMSRQPKLMRSAFHAGIRARIKQRQGGDLRLSERAALTLFERAVIPKIVAKFGGRLRFAFSGAAALSVEVGELIAALGIDVFEGYGMTEGSGVIATNRPGETRLGSVGKPAPGVRITLDRGDGTHGDEGEIIVYGSGVMAGYHGLEDATRETLTLDGGLRTGDLGRFDDDGFLYITGRVKELFKLSNGRYVAPAALEEKLQLSPYVTQAILYGDNQPYPVALLVVEPQALLAWAKTQRIELAPDALLRDPRTRALLLAEVEKHSRSFKAYERVRAIELELEPFTIDNGLLTPTLKVRRRRVTQKYGQRLQALYASSADAARVGSRSTAQAE